MRKLNTVIVCTVLIFCLAMISANAHAEVISTTFGPGYTYQGAGWLLGSYSAASMESVEWAVSFTPSNNYENVEFKFAAKNINVDEFTGLTVLLTTGTSIPDTTATIETVKTNVSGDPSALYTVSFASDLTMGTKYWVILTPDDLVKSFMHLHKSPSSFGDSAYSTNVTSGWIANFDETPAFEVAGDLQSAPVPEPATMLLLGAGLAGLGIMRKRFKV